MIDTPRRRRAPRRLPALCLLTLVATAVHAAERKLLVIGIDGVRPDALEATIAEGNAPHFERLITEGSYSPFAQSEDLTFSGPNWSTILHGVHRDKHNVTTNSYTENHLDSWPDFLSYLELHNGGWNTYRITTWNAIHVNQPTGADVDIFHDYASNGDELATQDLVQILSGQHAVHTGDPDAVFFYLADPDVAGHANGFHPSVAGYRSEIADVDRQLGEVLEAIEGRSTYADEEWLLLITSDHGGSIDGSHAGNTPETRAIPFIAAGPLAARGRPFPGGRNVDIATTALTYMGVTIDPAWQLDGHVVGLAPLPPPLATFDRNLIFNGGAEYDRGFSSFRWDQYASGWIDPGPQLTVIEYGAGPQYPTTDAPGPEARGANFFYMNNFNQTATQQTIDVSNLTAAFDDAPAEYVLAASLGALEDQDGSPLLGARFLDADGNELASAVIGPVLARDRGFQTGLLPRQAQGLVPPGTHAIEVELRAERGRRIENYGYADNLSLTLRSPPSPGHQLAGDCNQDGVLDMADGLCVLGALFLGDPSRFPCGNGLPGEASNLALLDWQLDGRLDLSDGLGLLRSLFNAGPPHPLAGEGECAPIVLCPDGTGCR